MKTLIKIVTLIIFVTTLAFSGNKKIVIDLSKQMAYAYNGKNLVYKGWISSGREGHRTPTGVFKILQKEKEHKSNLYPSKKGKSIDKVGGAKMPFMMRLTWDGIALHSGYTPNHPASHGCIRLKKSLAKKLFAWARVGTKVVVKGIAPRRVARKGSGFVDYIALAKAKNLKRYKKRYLAKKRVSKRVALAKREVAKKYSTQRAKIINRYARFSYKKINRLLRRSYREKRVILASKNISRYKKRKELRRIAWLVRVLNEAKHQKYKNRYKRYKKIYAKGKYIKRLS